MEQASRAGVAALCGLEQNHIHTWVKSLNTKTSSQHIYTPYNNQQITASTTSVAQP